MITALARGLLAHIPDDLDEPLDWIAIFNWLWFSTIGRTEHRRNQAELERREAERRALRFARGEQTDLDRIARNLAIIPKAGVSFGDLRLS